MIELILQNKEWLFSGAGIAVLGIVFGIFKKIRSKQAESQVVIHINNHGDDRGIADIEIEPSHIEKISNLSFVEMRDAIESAPPLQRDDVKKNFVGIKIEWDTYLKGATKNGDFVSLTLTSSIDKMMNTIWCKVQLSEYKELGILPEGSRIRVRGEIEEAGTWDVRLKNVALFFYE